ncbi:Major Facilitator Superfamily protein [compost metagenome]
MCQDEVSWKSRSRVTMGACLIGTFLTAGLNMGAIAAGRLVIPIVAISMGTSAVMVGTIVALFTAAPMLLSVPFGRWIDRTGTLLPVVVAASLSVTAAIIFCFAPYSFTLLLVASLIGAGCVFTHMAATRAVGAVGSLTNRSRNLGYLVLSYSLFQFLGPLIAGAAFQYSGAVAAIVALGGYALLSIGVVLLGWHYFRHEKSMSLPEKGKPRAYQLLAIRNLRGWILINSVFVAAVSFFPFIVSLHTVEIGFSAVQASWLLGSFSVGIFVSRVCTPLVTRRFSASKILITALIVSAMLYILIPFTSDIYRLCVLSFALGLPLGAGVPIALVMIYETAPEGRVNESVGLSMSVNNLLLTILPLLLGVSVTHFGIAPMVILWALAMIASAFLGALDK